MFFLQTPIVPAGSFAETLATDPEAALHQLVHDGIEFGLKVLAALAIYIVGAWIIRRVKKAQKKRFERRHTDPTLASFTQSFTSVVLTVLILVLAISALGINTTSLAALLAAGGMAIGMALSGTLQNFAGGIMLLAFKPFRVGDFIEAQGYSGTVTELTIVSTHITLPDNRRVIMPNGVLSNGSINNYTRNPLRRIEWNIGFAYGADEKTVQSVDLSQPGQTGETGFKVKRLPPAQAVSAERGVAEHPVSRSSSHVCHSCHAERRRCKDTVRHSRAHQRELYT